MSGNSILETLNCSRDTPEGRQPAENAETRRHFRKPSREEADEEHEKDRFRALRQSTKIDKGLDSMGITTPLAVGRLAGAGHTFITG